MCLNWYTSTRVVVNRPMYVLTWFHDLQVCRCSLWPFHCFTLPMRVMALRPTWTKRCTYSYIARETLTALSPDQTPALPTQANSNQGFNLVRLGIVLPPIWLDLAWILIEFEFSFAQLEPIFPPFGHLGQLEPNCSVTVCDYAVVVRQLIGFLASWFDLASAVRQVLILDPGSSWLELGVPFDLSFTHFPRILSGFSQF